MSERNDVDILLVEDNATDAELCIRSLRKQNLANRLDWVKDGAEALDFLFAEGRYADRHEMTLPRVVLLDLRLPKVDGLEVMRRMREDERTRSIPVVALTSSREDRDVAEMYRLGVNSFIQKPVEFDAFAKVVAQLGLYWLVVNRPPPPTSRRS
jgi:two-component system response regulator